MNTNVVVARDQSDLMESVIVKGDLSKLTADERARYYTEFCRSVGLNPLTQPLAYITLNGKLTLYALRGATDQLRALHDVSVEEMSESEHDGVYVVTCKVRNAKGRTDMAKGALSLSGLKGEALANGIMKCETKAKRRATLSICGLGLLDETEIETVPSAKPFVEANPASLTEVVTASATEPKATMPVVEHEPPRILEPPVDGAELAWGTNFVALARTSKSHIELIQWTRLNGDTIVMLEDKAPKLAGRIHAAINQISGELPPLVEQKLGDTVAAEVDQPNLLPPKESVALLRMLVRSLGNCDSMEAVDRWHAANAAALTTLQPYERDAAATHEEERRATLAEAVN